jgi:hypothetical protein
MAWIKLDCTDQESTIATDFDNYSDYRSGNLSLPISADDTYLAALPIHERPNTALLLRFVYCCIKYFTIAYKTTEQEDELTYLDRDWSK